MKDFRVILMMFYTLSNFLAASDSAKDVNDMDLKPSTKISLNDYVAPTGLWEIPALDSLWVYRPPSIQTHHSSDKESQHVVQKPPYSLTKLAKPLMHGFDPFFNKGHFEPFERRQKPVTLVNFRKNGVQSRKMVKPNSESADVAELQSSFNDISNSWHNEEIFI